MTRRTMCMVCLVVCWFQFSPASEGATDMKAGTAKAVITPQTDIWMSGYASRNHPSEGKFQDLYAKALALEDANGTRAVLVTVDLIGLPNALSERVAQRAEKETGLSRSALLLSASHTHSGPVIRDNLETMYNLSPEQWKRVTENTQFLEDQLVGIVKQAIGSLQPACVYRGNGKAGFAMNRRQYTLKGIVIGQNPIGPTDQDVPTLKVTDAKGNPLAIVFGYACHNTTLSFYQICGDYAGYAQEYVELAYPGAMAMFFIGCGADANPAPRGELKHAQQHGMELSRAVSQALAGSMQEVKGPIRTSFSRIDLPLATPPTKEQLEKQAQSDNQYIQRRAQYLLSILSKNGKIPDTYSYPVQVWSMADGFNIIALAGEVVVDYSLRLKHELGADRTWVMGYTNDVFAYIPSLRILREGGYEAEDSMIYYALPGPWAPPVEEMIIQEVHKRVAAR